MPAHQGYAEARKATFVGLIAIPLWSLLAALTVLAGAIPPLELVAITFTLGSLVGLAFLAASGKARAEMRSLSAAPVMLGIAGLFGYHFSYFLALQNAPPIEASLLNYLWPVLIVLFSSALPERAASGGLSASHIIGALIAFGGAALAILGGGTINLSGNAFGYGMALLAALIWSSYSVLTRLFRSVPSSAVTLYCLGTAALAWAAHLSLERFVLPSSPVQIAAIALLGIGPLGAAFYAWDYGCKHGDLRILGVTAYFAPVLSTLLLAVTGLGAPKPLLWFAALLITGGALLASKTLLLSQRST
jgi:drug/metabolite transporter (DMT)-like permease